MYKSAPGQAHLMAVGDNTLNKHTGALTGRLLTCRYLGSLLRMINCLITGTQA